MSNDRPLKFGAFFLFGSPQMLPSQTIYDRVLDYMVLADELGYDSVWMAEHHFSNYGYVPNPLMMAIKVAERTQRVRIGTAVLVLPFWHPLRAAEDIAMADQLTGGRLEVGVARGYQPYEFARFGVPYDEARERTDEVLEVLLRALTTEGFSYQGRHHDIPETTTFPRPLQQPSPPIWLAAHTRESFEIAARLGLKAFTTNSGRPVEHLREGWEAYLAARQTYGVESPIEFAVQQQMCVAPTDAEALEQMQHFRYASRQVAALRRGREQVERGFSQEIPFEGEATLDEMLENRTISGSPAAVRRKVAAYRDISGMTMLNCTFAMGSMEPAMVKRSMRLFAEEVMPAFR